MLLLQPMRTNASSLFGPLLLSLCVACASSPSPRTESSTPAVPATTGEARPAGPPAARVEEVVDERFGLAVKDPYRWMEQPGSEELTTWMTAQGEYATRALATLQGREALHARVRELGEGTSTVTQVVPVAGRTFFFKLEAGDAARKFMVREADGSKRVLLAPTVAKDGGGFSSIDNFTPSFDGRRVVVNVAENGREITQLRVIDVETGRMLPDVIERVWGEFAGAWLPDGSGFFYTQMVPDQPGNPTFDRLLGMRAFLHRLGRPVSEDTVVLGPDVGGVPVSPSEFPLIRTSPTSRHVLGMGSGARPERHVFVARLDDLLQGRARWTEVARYEDEVEEAALHGDDLYLLSRQGTTNRRVLAVSASRPELARAKVAVAEDAEAVLVGIGAAKDALYLRETKDGQARLRRLPYGTAKPEVVPLPVEGWIAQLAADTRVPGVTLPIESWTRPSRHYAFEPARGAFRDTGLASTSTADFGDILVERMEVPSADGERVPLTVLRRRDSKLDGSNPTILSAYGGYGFSQWPAFRPQTLAWLERGGILAIAHVRGGGEKGPRWHLAGKGPNKPKGIQDFIACAEHLTSKGYTSRARLAATGRSMGGVLVGPAVATRPDLFRVAALDVALLNATRFMEGSNGANQQAELGTPGTAEGFRALLAMDAYQNVKAGTAYPAVILNVGLNDTRLPPWHSAKLAARLQSSTTSAFPVLLRVETGAGHGLVGALQSQQSAQTADTWAFFLWQMGDPAFRASP
ncbi:prolyl oligopeptidase family serine peptidase [Pyxidicoccus sp. 3LG]